MCCDVTNPEKTELGLDEVEYVGHLISSEGTSFTPEKRLQILEFPPPATHKALLQFIGLVRHLISVAQLCRVCPLYLDDTSLRSFFG